MKKELIFRLSIVCVIFVLAFKFGVDPMMNGNKKDVEWAKGKISREQGKYDVVVFGEEPEGIAAAISAARSGAKTLLVSEGGDLGGVVSRCLLVDLEPCFGPEGEILNRGIYSDIYNRLGKNFSVEKYISTVKGIAEKEKNLEVLYNAVIETPILQDNTIEGIHVKLDGVRKDLYGKIFIDASRDGKILNGCGVPSFRGSQDLNMENRFLPAELNFMVEGIKASQIQELLKSPDFYKMIGKYKPADINIYFSRFFITPQSGDRAIISGMNTIGFDAENKEALNKAYKNAAAEAGFFTDFLKSEFTEFQDIKLSGIANEFYIRESVHFIGEYLLSVNDVLEGRNFSNKIALGSHSVDGSKFVRDSVYIIGKPEQYSIPLGCILPLKIDNLLMVGSKASYSSLAASSAGAMSVSIAEGQAAGIISVFAIVKDLKPRDIVKENKQEINEEIGALLAGQGLKLPDFSVKNKNESQWAYPYIRQLICLGLIAGGEDNDFGTAEEATQKDFAILLLNGIYRLAPEKYSLEFDSRLRKSFIDARLTKEKAGEILLTMYGKGIKAGQAYEQACKEGYIDNVIQSRIKGNVLKIEDIFYLSSLNIKKYTGKEILEE